MDGAFKPAAQVAADEHTASFCNNIHRGFFFSFVVLPCFFSLKIFMII